MSYVIAALGHLVFVGMLTKLPAIAPSSRAARPGPRDLFAGVAFMRRNPIFLGAISLDLFAVLLGGAVALLPIYARDILQVGPAGLGLLRSAPSLGALTAALISTRLPPWERPGRVLRLNPQLSFPSKRPLETLQRRCREAYHEHFSRGRMTGRWHEELIQLLCRPQPIRQ